MLEGEDGLAETSSVEYIEEQLMAHSEMACVVYWFIALVLGRNVRALLREYGLFARVMQFREDMAAAEMIELIVYAKPSIFPIIVSELSKLPSMVLISSRTL